VFTQLDTITRFAFYSVRISEFFRFMYAHLYARMYECTDSDMTGGTGPPLTL